MKFLNVTQGSDAWHAARARCHTASEAPAMMGASPHLRRTELLHAKATGHDRDVSWYVQTFLFDRGHEAEAAARPLVEELIGEELFPTTATDDDGRLLASYDGLTLLGDTVYEHKLWSESLAAQVRAGELDPLYYWQMEQQLLVSGATRIIFVVSDGTRERFEWMEYRAVDGRAAALLAGWAQFDADLAAYDPATAAVPPPAVGRAPDALPALRVSVTGMVTESNLREFRDNAIAVFQGISTDLQTDQDFADAEQTVKWCSDVESRLAAAKDHALGQTRSIDELFRAIDAISAEARTKRLELTRLVQQRKDAIRAEIVETARRSVAEHYQTINATLGPHALAVPASLPSVIATAMKAKKTIATLRDAANTAAAQLKIDASQCAERVRACMAVLAEHAAGRESLFADRVALCAQKTPEDLRNLIAIRIADADRQEQERIAAAEARGRQMAAAAEQRERDVARQHEPAAPTPAAVAVDVGATTALSGARIRLGDINALIAPLTINAEGLAQLGFQPVATDRAAKLYAAHDVPSMLQKLISVLSAVQVQQLRSAA